MIETRNVVGWTRATSLIFHDPKTENCQRAVYIERKRVEAPRLRKARQDTDKLKVGVG